MTTEDFLVAAHDCFFFLCFLCARLQTWITLPMACFLISAFAIKVEQMAMALRKKKMWSWDNLEKSSHRAPPSGQRKHKVQDSYLAASDLGVYLRHSHEEWFTVSKLLGIHCPAQGHFARIDDCSADRSYKFRVMLPRFQCFCCSGVQSFIINLFHPLRLQVMWH